MFFMWEYVVIIISFLVFLFSEYMRVSINERIVKETEKVKSLQIDDVFFEDEKVLNVYKQTLLSLGKCPECNDYLFLELDKDKNSKGYTATITCVNHNCNYTKDYTKEFNEKIGIKKVDLGKYSWKIKDSPSNYQNKNHNPCNTGTLKSSVELKVVDELPVNPRNNTLYYKYTEFGGCDVYYPTGNGYCKVFAYDKVLSHDRDAFGRKKREGIRRVSK